MAAGVGKTYRIQQQAKTDGHDVVIGYADPTQQLRLPRDSRSRRAWRAAQRPSL